MLMFTAGAWQAICECDVTIGTTGDDAVSEHFFEPASSVPASKQSSMQQVDSLGLAKLSDRPVLVYVHTP